MIQKYFFQTYHYVKKNGPEKSEIDLDQSHNYPYNWVDQHFLKNFYNVHNQLVEKYFTETHADKFAGQFIKFNVKQGWTPITKLLKIPDIEASFPHVNDTKNILNILNIQKNENIISGVLLVSGLVLVIKNLIFTGSLVSLCLGLFLMSFPFIFMFYIFDAFIFKPGKFQKATRWF